jgi:hypothetical protein
VCVSQDELLQAHAAMMELCTHVQARARVHSLLIQMTASTDARFFVVRPRPRLTV